MLLDLDAATLTVWVNGERKGVMAQPGMTDRWRRTGAYGPSYRCVRLVARLEGPLRWVVGLLDSSVAIPGPLPLPAA